MNQEKPSARIGQFIVTNRTSCGKQELPVPYCGDIRREMDALNDRLAALEKRQNEFECGVGFKLSQTKTEKQALASCEHLDGNAFKYGSNLISKDFVNNICPFCSSGEILISGIKPAPAKGLAVKLFVRSKNMWNPPIDMLQAEAFAACAVDEVYRVVEKMTFDEWAIISMQNFGDYLRKELL